MDIACDLDDGRLRMHRLVGGQAAGRDRARGLDLRPEGGHAPARPDPRARAAAAGPLRRRATSRIPTRSGRPSRRVGATHLLHLAGLQTPTCRAQSDPGCDGQRDRDAGRLRGGAGPEGSGPAGRLRQLGGGARAGRSGGAGRVGDEVRLAPLTHYGAYKVCNELNARVYWLDHGITSIGLRPWTVYGVGRDFGMTSEPTKAIKSVAVGPALPDQLRRRAGPSIRRRRGGDVPAGPRPALRGGRGVQPERRRRADRVVRRGAVRGRPGGSQPGHATATVSSRSPRTSTTAASRAGSGRSRATPLREGIAETYRRFVALRDQGRLDLSDL